MKVKIGNVIHSSDDGPIMVVLTDQDKENIAKMLPECSKYCEYSDDCNADEIEKWIETE